MRHAHPDVERCHVTVPHTLAPASPSPATTKGCVGLLGDQPVVDVTRQHLKVMQDSRDNITHVRLTKGQQELHTVGWLSEAGTYEYVLFCMHAILHVMRIRGGALVLKLVVILSPVAS
jgi:hypothetical protein